MFNHKKKDQNKRDCNGSTIYTGDMSYISYVKWEDFIEYPERYIDKALAIQSNIDEYDLVKRVK